MADPLNQLLRGELPVLRQTVTGEIKSDGVRPTALLCGSFNPVHAGHLRLAAVASQRLAKPVAFELGVVNADKPPLDADDVRRRLSQFVGRSEVWLTRHATFVTKSALFLGCTFVVGQDTADRIVDPRFYDKSDMAMLAALRTLADRNCQFLIAGRVDPHGQFRPAQAVAIPDQFCHMFMCLSEAEFREDISSTSIRGIVP